MEHLNNSNRRHRRGRQVYLGTNNSNSQLVGCSDSSNPPEIHSDSLPNNNSNNSLPTVYLDNPSSNSNNNCPRGACSANPLNSSSNRLADYLLNLQRSNSNHLLVVFLANLPNNNKRGVYSVNPTSNNNNSPNSSQVYLEDPFSVATPLSQRPPISNSNQAFLARSTPIHSNNHSSKIQVCLGIV